MNLDDFRRRLSPTEWDQVVEHSGLAAYVRGLEDDLSSIRKSTVIRNRLGIGDNE